MTVADLISVIVPVYNGEKYLRGCIQSIISQSYQNIEIIIINDGSTDNSGQICNAYALADNRVRVINSNNHGPSAARNIGIEDSQGSFIFFIDADDVIENNALKSLIESYYQHPADITVGDFKKQDHGDTDSGHARVFANSRLLGKQDILNYIRCYLKKPNKFPLFVYSWGRLFKSSIIKNNRIFFNTDLRTFEDVAFNFSYLNYTNDIFFLKEKIYNHRVYDNYTSASMMISDNPQDLFGYRQALVNASDFLKKSDPQAEIRKEIGHAYISYTIIQLIRTCGQINTANKKKIYEVIQEIINESKCRDSLQFYAPEKGESKILALLMKFKVVWLIALVCRYKAHKRYKKKALPDEPVKGRNYREN